MKVYKSVGAVAVYNGRRAALLAGAGVALVAGAGVVAGSALGGSSDAAAPPRTVTQTSGGDAVTPAVAGPDRAAVARARKRGYVRGYRAGTRRLLPRSFKAGGAYVIRLEKGRKVPLRVRQHATVVAGKTYYLCAGGVRLCIATG